MAGCLRISVIKLSALLVAAAHEEFIVIMDAGSTGTRVHVFNHTARVQYAYSFPVTVQEELVIPTLLGQFAVRPGISAFRKNISGLQPYITPLVEYAKDLISKHDKGAALHKIPIYLGATAGMRMLDDVARNDIMDALRSYFTSQKCPFSMPKKAQTRVLAGEEEGAFGWLAANLALGTLSASPITTYGALDLGGASAQISFIPSFTSILSNMFPMHFGNFSDGAIHLYTHSFLQYGYVVGFQNSAGILMKKAMNSHDFAHPCLPSDVVWNTEEIQYGVSTSGGYIERTNGPYAIHGRGSFANCRALANAMMTHRAECPAEPCSLMSIYQPRLEHSKFLAFGEYMKAFNLLNVTPDSGMPPLMQLERRLAKWCSMTAKEQSAASGLAIGTPGAKLELSCWMATWALELLTSGLGFPIDTQVFTWGKDIDWTRGFAIYEVNFFPIHITDSLHVDPNTPVLSGLTTELPTSISLTPAAAVVSSLAVLLTGLFTGYAIGRANRFRVSCDSQAGEPLLAQ